jgi:hypothetical protein
MHQPEDGSRCVIDIHPRQTRNEPPIYMLAGLVNEPSVQRQIRLF